MPQLHPPKPGRWALLGIMLLTMPLVGGGASSLHPPLHMGINYWPPYTYPSDHERAPGLVQVVLSGCVDEAGYRMEFRDATIPDIFDDLQRGRLDVHVLSYKPSRTEYLAYGRQPLFQAAYRPFVLAGRGIEIEDLSDLDGYSIGHKRDVRYTKTFEAYLESRRQQGALAEMESEVEIVDQLVAGEIDVAIMMLSSGLRRVAAQGALDRVRVFDFDVRTTSECFFAVSNRSERGRGPELPAVDGRRLHRTPGRVRVDEEDRRSVRNGRYGRGRGMKNRPLDSAGADKVWIIASEGDRLPGSLVGKSQRVIDRLREFLRQTQ